MCDQDGVQITPGYGQSRLVYTKQGGIAGAQHLDARVPTESDLHEPL